MPDIKSVLNEEIRRLSRKEIKALLEPLTRSLATQRKLCQELRERVKALEAGVKQPATAEEAPCAPRAGRGKLRISQDRIVKMRAKLHLTQTEFAKLVGVNQFTVSHWESGKTRPRASALQKIASLRGKSRSAVLKMLAGQQ